MFVVFPCYSTIIESVLITTVSLIMTAHGARIGEAVTDFPLIWNGKHFNNGGEEQICLLSEAVTDFPVLFVSNASEGRCIVKPYEGISVENICAESKGQVDIFLQAIFTVSNTSLQRKLLTVPTKCNPNDDYALFKSAAVQRCLAGFSGPTTEDAEAEDKYAYAAYMLLNFQFSSSVFIKNIW